MQVEVAVPVATYVFLRWEPEPAGNVCSTSSGALVPSVRQLAASWELLGVV